MALIGSAASASAQAVEVEKWWREPWVVPTAVVVALVAVIALVWALTRRRVEPPPELEAPDRHLVSSRFEQLFSEVQGLLLQTREHESKGSFRKIENLVRGLLERLGHVDARNMDEQQIRDLLAKDALPANQTESLREVFMRCREGADENVANYDLSAAQLLEQFQTIIHEIEAQATGAAE